MPFERGQSVLDGLRWIRANRDPTLAIRFSCINANACKECMMELDGETVYACTARLEPREMSVDAAVQQAARARPRHRDRAARRTLAIRAVVPCDARRLRLGRANASFRARQGR